MNRRQLAVAAGASMCGLAQPSVALSSSTRDIGRFSGEVALAQKVLDAYLTAFNARDVTAFEATLHFPHVRFASGTVAVLQPGDHKSDMFRRSELSEWDHSKWMRRDVVHASADKVHFDTEFARLRRDGTLIGSFDSLYIVTRMGARWGVQGRSSYAA
jgi:hypothetical protein